jgi:hypothetical protein
MFSYRPTKGGCWGHATRPHNTFKAAQKMQIFFDTYFEPAVTEGLTLILNRHQDVENRVPQIREKAVRVFGNPGQPESVNWILPSGDCQKALAFIVDCQPWPKPPCDPIWLTFRCHLDWKVSALPKVEWPEEFLKPDPINEKLRRQWFRVKLMNRGFIMFLMGIGFPISVNDPASYEFLKRFSTDAPFKMNPKHFQVFTPIGKKGKMAWRKPDAEVRARLDAVIG